MEGADSRGLGWLAEIGFSILLSMLVIMAGLPGSGKTTLAEEIALRTGAAVLNKDHIRAVLFSPADLEFSAEQDDFVMQVMLDAASYLFAKDRNRLVILDGRTFSRTAQLDRVIHYSEEKHLPWTILECICSERSARERLSSSAVHPASNRNFDLYLEVKSRFEPITYRKSVISTDTSLQLATDGALEALGLA